ncbi:MAG: glycosyltransferase family 2 protein [Candidatus Eremiobacteraeota bacterium]|nr:glycosyltransferase family 2 protein [Candidatus Eremiobacteraeota bacterium]
MTDDGAGEDPMTELERFKLEYLNLLDVLIAERGNVEAHMRFLTGDPYPRWIARHAIRPAELERRRKLALQLHFRPTFSLLMAVGAATPLVHVRAAIDAVIGQAYDMWQLCIVVPATERRLRTILETYSAADMRIKLALATEPGPVAALSAALAVASGEFVGVVDADGVLAPHGLFAFAIEVNVRPDYDAIYSDSDAIEDDGRRHDPQFKPGWSPDTLLSRPYIGRLALLRRTLVEAAGGFRAEFEGSHEWDLLLRIADRTHRFARIPDVLYHVRSPWQAQPQIDLALIGNAIARRGEPGHVAKTKHAGVYAIRYALKGSARTTIVVPTRDAAADVERCLRSVFERSTYRDFDVLLVDNGSTDPVALELFERLSRDEPRLRVVRDDSPFNFSRLNNNAARLTTADYLIFLNNDTEVIAPEWIEAMLGYAQRSTAGAVGALLLYPEERVQHAGVVLGLGGGAGHSHKQHGHGDSGYLGAIAGATNYSAVTAACLAIRRELFEAVGGFDERLAVAFNDVDLCLRLGATGKLNVYVPEARLYPSNRNRAVPMSTARAPSDSMKRCASYAGAGGSANSTIRFTILT